jgi:hypothetical protein
LTRSGHNTISSLAAADSADDMIKITELTVSTDEYMTANAAAATISTGY